MLKKIVQINKTITIHEIGKRSINKEPECILPSQSDNKNIKKKFLLSRYIEKYLFITGEKMYNL